MEYNITFKKFKGHLKTVLTHKWWVFYYCCKAGIPFRGLIHDLSKFSPIEFWESVKYYQGGSSPINACKADKGYSLAWQHHKGRNPHHYEYWVDYLDNGGKPIMMPYKYAVEMICDYLAAARVYSNNMGKAFSYEAEYEWWLKKKEVAKMHEETKRFITDVFNFLKDEELDELYYLEESKFNLKDICKISYYGYI